MICLIANYNEKVTLVTFCAGRRYLMATNVTEENPVKTKKVGVLESRKNLAEEVIAFLKSKNVEGSDAKKVLGKAYKLAK